MQNIHLLLDSTISQNEKIKILNDSVNELLPWKAAKDLVIQSCLASLVSLLDQISELVNREENIENCGFLDSYVSCFDTFLARKELYHRAPVENKRNIVIWGNSLVSRIITFAFDHRKVNILNEKNILTSNDLNTIEFDYLILCDNTQDDLSMVPPERIVNYWLYLNYFWLNTPRNYYNLKQFQMGDNYAGIATGISYILRAIDFEKLDYKTASLTSPGQDLFYDFEMFKWAMQDSACQNVKYCILGLNYYCFQYDLSKSHKFGIRSLCYYPQTLQLHHYYTKEDSIRFFDVMKQVLPEFMKENHVDILFEHYKRYNESFMHGLTGRFEEANLSAEQYEQVLDVLKTLFNKDYPDTLKEYETIFDEYLRYLDEKNVKVFVLIPPFPDIYIRNIPGKMKQEFEEIVARYKEKYNFELIDLSNDPRFTNEHFGDFSHVNVYGAEIVSSILNERISTSTIF